MELVKLVVIAALLLANVFCQEMDVDDWREGIEEVRLFKLFVYLLKFYIYDNMNKIIPKFPQDFGDGKVLTDTKNNLN